MASARGRRGKGREPFVGAAGLNKIIAMGLQREAVYIGNILKWRPDTTSPMAIAAHTGGNELCLPYLKAQIEIVQPK